MEIPIIYAKIASLLIRIACEKRIDSVQFYVTNHVFFFESDGLRLIFCAMCHV